MDALNLVEDTVAVGGLQLRILRPRQADALLSEEAFEHEEFLPYWAELWPSGLALARIVRRRDLEGLHVLELGCGLGLPSIVAALGGAEVLATDWSPEALEVAAANAERNGADV
jgi:predicted nicotinamide N-methyase